MLALLDGNNFYVSCERVFRPSLQGRPVVVLSNNDGCAISRSNEAKALGIKMAQPHHEFRHLEDRAGLSTAVLQATHTAAPGTLIRVALDPASPLAAGIPKATESTPTAWLMYDNDDLMSLGLGSTVARFPARGEPAFHTSGLAIGVDELAGSAAIVDEPVGNGRSVVFSFDPNFRAWPEGTQRILWNALYGANPVAAAASAKVRAAAIDTASRAAKALPDTGKAIRIVVQAADADTTRALLQSYGAEFKELRKTERTVFVIANREALSREEHPYVRDLARDLTQLITPISFSMP